MKKTLIKNKSLISLLTKIIVYICAILVVLYVIVLYLWVKPIIKLHTLQTKSWANELQKFTILAKNDKKYKNDISFWYCYSFINTDEYTIWLLFNLKNKFSDEMTCNIYTYNNKTGKKTLESINYKYSDLETFEKEDGTLVIKLGNNYYQEISIMKDKSFINIDTGKTKLSYIINIDDCNTNQASRIPRYQPLKYFTHIEGSETSTPGEWFNDNPFIGKITNVMLNNSDLGNGNVWFDNFVGVNNNYLCPYIWFVILNDDWLIYLLWFETYDKRNDSNTVKPILIKDRKNNKMIYSGITGKTPAIYSPFNEIEMTYNSRKNLTDDNYDDYDVTFNSPDIKISIKSIKGESHNVIRYPYYRSTPSTTTTPQKSWDVKYKTVLDNIMYVEYITNVDVSIEYDGKHSSFKSRQIIDAMYPNDINIPNKITYEQ